MHVLIRKLKALHSLSDEEAAALLDAIAVTCEVRRGEDIAGEGSEPKYSTVIVEGIACRYRRLEDGRRQILSLQYPGDVTDLHSYVLKKLDHAVGALTHCTISQIPHSLIQMLCEKYPNLAYALWRDTMVDTAKLHAAIECLGARSPKERLALFLAEQYVRMSAVGVMEMGRPGPFSITQTDLADATGLSLVHVNKTIKKLKDEGLISWNRGQLQNLRLEALKKTAMFNGDYLHFKPGHVV